REGAASLLRALAGERIAEDARLVVERAGGRRPRRGERLAVESRAELGDAPRERGRAAPPPRGAAEARDERDGEDRERRPRRAPAARADRALWVRGSDGRSRERARELLSVREAVLGLSRERA